jgi:hypothetical protein
MLSNKVETLYIMFDSETTGLDTRNAVAWQIGMVAFTSDYCEVSNFITSSGVTPGEWEPSTLNFAHKTYSPEVVAIATKQEYAEYIKMIGSAVDYITQHVNRWGFKNVYLICNHTEFDWPIFLNSLSKAGIAIPLTGLVHYQNKLDMQSLCIGKVGAKHKEVYAELKKVSAPVQHLALADCYFQIGMLKYFGVELP